MNDSMEAAPDVPPKPRRSGLAVAALVLGLLGCIPGLGLLAILLGIVALVDIKRGRSNDNRVIAICGVVAGAVTTLCLAFGVYTVADYGHRRRYHARCPNNLHQIGMALSSYAGDYNEEFPPDLGTLYPDYVDNAKTFLCHEASENRKIVSGAGRGDGEPTSYVYVAGLRDGLSSSCVLAFDRPGDHGKAGLNVMFMGAQVQWMSEGDLQKALAETRELARKQGREIKLVGE